MTAQIKKLLSLNLALLLLVMTAVPVSAEDEAIEHQALQSASVEAEVIADALQKAEERVELLEATEPYKINVGGRVFYSNEDVSGVNWKYTAEDNTLVLTNYSGSTIVAMGGLTIVTEGTVSVTGADDTDGGYYGIVVDGDLTLLIAKGSLTVTGGAGNMKGAEAVASNGQIDCVCLGEATFIGGQTYLNQYGDDDMLQGGNAMQAKVVRLIGDGTTLIGGKGSTEASGIGGCGVLANEVYVYGDCTIKGGSAYCGGPGIFYIDYAYIGVVNALIQSGSGSVQLDAIVTNTDNSWYRSRHTTWYGSYTSMRFEVNQYTLDLWGMGGVTTNRATFTSLTDYYPAEYKLADYPFEREGYVQVAWRTTADKLVPLNTVYCPTADTRLMAEWIAVENGDIVLNSNGGKTADGYIYKNYGSADVTLPGVTFEEDTLLGWCSEIVPEENEELKLSGRWYTDGYTVPTNAGCVQTLYAQSESTGQYALFHTGEGTASEGGNILVYGTLSTATNLQVTAPGETDVTAPRHYELAGWSSDAQANTVEYESGDTVALEVGETQHFYAQWKPIYYEVVQDEIVFTVAPVISDVQVSVPSNLYDASEVTRCMAALYDENGRMLSCDIAGYQAGTDCELLVSSSKDTAAVCKVFFLGEDHQPVRQAIVYDLTSFFVE